MNEPSRPLTCKLLDANGAVLGQISLIKPYSVIELPAKGVDKVSIDGTAEFFEIIPLK